MKLSDAEASEAVGPKCPECGWRRGWHDVGCSQFDDANRVPGIADANVRAAAARATAGAGWC